MYVIVAAYLLILIIIIIIELELGEQDTIIVLLSPGFHLMRCMQSLIRVTKCPVRSKR